MLPFVASVGMALKAAAWCMPVLCFSKHLLQSVSRTRPAPRSQFIFRSDDSIIGEQIFRVSPGDLAAGIYIFAVFNMNYFRHQTFLYELEVPHSRSANTPEHGAPYLLLLTP